jgi:hypothetical protein
MDLSKLRVNDLSTGKVYKFTSNENENCILEIHYCSSYFQFVVQDAVKHENGFTIYTHRDLCFVFENANWIDLSAINNNERCSYWFEE